MGKISFTTFGLIEMHVSGQSLTGSVAQQNRASGSNRQAEGLSPSGATYVTTKPVRGGIKTALALSRESISHRPHYLCFNGHYKPKLVLIRASLDAKRAKMAKTDKPHIKNSLWMGATHNRPNIPYTPRPDVLQ